MPARRPALRLEPRFDIAAYGSGPMLETARALRARDLTAVAVAERSLEAVERRAVPTNGVAYLMADAALDRAAGLDAEAALGREDATLLRIGRA